METENMVESLKALEGVTAEATSEEREALNTICDRRLREVLYGYLTQQGLDASRQRLARLMGDTREPRTVAGNKVVKRLQQPTALRRLREEAGVPAYLVAPEVGLSVTKYTNFERGELNELDIRTKKYERALASLRRLVKDTARLEALREKARTSSGEKPTRGRNRLREMLAQGRPSPRKSG